MKWNHCSSVPALPRSRGQGLPSHTPLSLGLLWPPDSLIALPNAARVVLTRTRVPPPLLPQVVLTRIWMFLPGLLALCSWKWRLLRFLIWSLVLFYRFIFIVFFRKDGKSFAADFIRRRKRRKKTNNYNSLFTSAWRAKTFRENDWQLTKLPKVGKR
jgi:hypothetical protein